MMHSGVSEWKKGGSTGTEMVVRSNWKQIRQVPTWRTWQTINRTALSPASAEGIGGV